MNLIDKLTPTEAMFLDKFVDSDKIHPKNAAYELMAKKMMEKIVYDKETDHGMVSNKAYELAQSILYKIVSEEADAWIEELLSSPTPNTPVKPKRMVKKNTTKKLSQDAFVKEYAGTVDVAVLNIISVNSGITRREIANETGMFLSTVCGACARLYKNDLIRVSGVKLDLETNRKVETLQVRGI